MISFALTLRTLSAEDLGPSPRPQSLPQSGHSGLLDLYTREHLDVGVFAACAALIISKSLSALCILLFHYHFSPVGTLHILMSQGFSAARCFSQLQIVAISNLPNSDIKPAAQLIRTHIPINISVCYGYSSSPRAVVPHIDYVI